jgi:hypothetical protein
MIIRRRTAHSTESACTNGSAVLIDEVLGIHSRGETRAADRRPKNVPAGTFSTFSRHSVREMGYAPLTTR